MEVDHGVDALGPGRVDDARELLEVGFLVLARLGFVAFPDEQESQDVHAQAREGVELGEIGDLRAGRGDEREVGSLLRLARDVDAAEDDRAALRVDEVAVLDPKLGGRAGARGERERKREKEAGKRVESE
jgi:hypothetical protein